MAREVGFEPTLHRFGDGPTAVILFSYKWSAWDDSNIQDPQVPASKAEGLPFTRLHTDNRPMLSTSPVPPTHGR